MTVTPTSLTRAAGISAAVAGLLFIAVQIKHPAALAGITGMYLRQVRQTGIPGLVGYSGVGYLAGGVLFGLALFRARILARWASGLLVLGALAALALSWPVPAGAQS